MFPSKNNYFNLLTPSKKGNRIDFNIGGITNENIQSLQI